MIKYKSISKAILIVAIIAIITLNITIAGAYSITETKFITIGDPQGDSSATKTVVNFINNMPSSDVDFVVFLGDYIDTATVSEIKKLNKKYYVVEGNHDVGKFNGYWGKNPAQYYHINGLQIVIPPYKWSSYNWGQVSKSIPAVVFSHAPMLPNCGTTDSLHKSGFGMKVETDKLNMIAAYAGHTHTFQKTILNRRLYVAEDSLSSGDRGTCKDGASKYIGYTTIKADGTVYYSRIAFKLRI